MAMKTTMAICIGAALTISSAMGQQDRRGAEYYEVNPAKWHGQSITLHVLAARALGRLSDDKQSAVFSLETVEGRIYAFVPNDQAENFARRMANKQGKKTVQGTFLADGYAGPTILIK